MAVSTIDVVALDGDGLGTWFDAPSGDALGETPELDAADRWRPLPTATPITATTSTTARAELTATSQRREALRDRIQLSFTAILPPAEPGLQTPPKGSRFPNRDTTPFHHRALPQTPTPIMER